ncbi:MAG: homoserine dehydrogenase, partial [Candidatus Lokiarchaeota archaeon]
MRYKVGLIGKGNVGSALIHLLHIKQSLLEKQLDINFTLNAIFKSDGALLALDNQGLNIPKIIDKKYDIKKMAQWSEKVFAIDYLSKSNFDIIIETTPTNPESGEPGYSHIIKALSNKIDVVTSNKGPFFLYYKKITNL